MSDLVFFWNFLFWKKKSKIFHTFAVLTNPCRGLLRDCEIIANLHLTFVSSSSSCFPLVQVRLGALLLLRPGQVPRHRHQGREQPRVPRCHATSRVTVSRVTCAAQAGVYRGLTGWCGTPRVWGWGWTASASSWAAPRTATSTAPSPAATR